MCYVKGNYKTFDVILVDFGEVEFAGEQGGKRPAVIVQNNIGNIHSQTTLVIPFSTKLKKMDQATHSFFESDMSKGLKYDSVLLGECLRQISEQRIIKKLGHLFDKNDKIKVKEVYDANFGLSAMEV